MNLSAKILSFNEVLGKVEEFKAQGSKVVLSIGVYDLIHPGIINHLESAKKQGDILVVGVFADQYAKLGPGRPIFGVDYRVNTVAALECVDIVCVVENKVPYESVFKIRPDIFAKGRIEREHDKLVYGREMDTNLAEFGDIAVYETDGFSFSSSHIINKLLDIYPEDTASFLRDFASRYDFKSIAERIHSLGDMKVLLIGDGIIDEYHYCESMNKSAKTPLVVNRYINHEVFPGGAFAIANHLSGICGSVHLVSLLGQEDSREEYILHRLRPNVSSKFFYREHGPTIVKKRYINEALNWKLFEVNYINNEYVGEREESDIIEYLDRIIPSYDMVVISDFGHGFISTRIMREIEKRARVLAINTQTNAANAGYNLITKYRRPHFVCLDEVEVRLACQERFDDIEKIARRVREGIEADYLIATLGRYGSIGVSRDGSIYRTPVFSTKVVDTIGAGDAFFAFTAPCFARDFPPELVSFIGNAVGALAVQIVGNARPVERHELLEFIYTILK